jgi:hypothetical protein
MNYVEPLQLETNKNLLRLTIKSCPAEPAQATVLMQEEHKMYKCTASAMFGQHDQQDQLAVTETSRLIVYVL